MRANPASFSCTHFVMNACISICYAESTRTSCMCQIVRGLDSATWMQVAKKAHADDGKDAFDAFFQDSSTSRFAQDQITLHTTAAVVKFRRLYRYPFFSENHRLAKMQWCIIERQCHVMKH